MSKGAERLRRVGVSLEEVKLRDMNAEMKNIVVAVEFDEVTEDLVTAAGNLAKGIGAQLHLVHVYDEKPEVFFTPPYAVPLVIEDESHKKEALAAERQRVRAMARVLTDDGVNATGYMRPLGNGVASSIVDFVEEIGADLVIAGNHRRGRIEKVLLGSVSEALLRQLKIPLLIIPRDMES